MDFRKDYMEAYDLTIGEYAWTIFFRSQEWEINKNLKGPKFEGPSHIVDSIRVAGIVAPFQSCQQITTSNSDPTLKRCRHQNRNTVIYCF